MTHLTTAIDVLCVGHACYDLVFSVARHPGEDEKIFADGFLGCGGGPAANAAVTVARLGYKAAFAGYLGDDLYGEMHRLELTENAVDTTLVVRGSLPTPLSAVLVKPDGKRTLINYKGGTQALPEGSIDFFAVQPKVLLFDGHEPHLSIPLARRARREGIPTVLDAGSLHPGTAALVEMVDYAICSEKFARQFAGTDGEAALARIAKVAPAAVVTLGENGLIWRKGEQRGALPAFPVAAIDTTGAGDAFHGAFAAAVAAEMEWPDVLRYAAAAGALCCTKMGARQGLPAKEELQALFSGVG
jgi:sulfofructose kinase